MNYWKPCEGVSDLIESTHQHLLIAPFDSSPELLGKYVTCNIIHLSDLSLMFDNKDDKSQVFKYHFLNPQRKKISGCNKWKHVDNIF